MTDYERWKLFLTSQGVDFTEQVGKSGKLYLHMAQGINTTKVLGENNGFFADVDFNPDGSLIGIGGYEWRGTQWMQGDAYGEKDES